MWRRTIKSNTFIEVNDSYEGETIEMKMERVVSSGEPINEGAQMIYTDRREGVRPELDIRTDRWDVALDAMDKVTKSQLAKRVEFYKKDDPKANPKVEPKVEPKVDGGAKSE